MNRYRKNQVVVNSKLMANAQKTQKLINSRID